MLAESLDELSSPTPCPVCQALASVLASSAALASELDRYTAPYSAAAARQLAQGWAETYRAARAGCCR